MATTKTSTTKKASSGGKAAAAKNGGSSKRPQYPENVRSAAKWVRETLNADHAPGPKQHVAVRKALGDRDPLEVVGLSETKLRAYAQKKADLTRDETKAMRELGNEVGDPFAKGRALAAILAAYVAELKAQKASA